MSELHKIVYATVLKLQLKLLRLNSISFLLFVFLLAVFSAFSRLSGSNVNDECNNDHNDIADEFKDNNSYDGFEDHDADKQLKTSMFVIK